MLTLGIAGTAKNTGKTTTATLVMAQALRRGISTGLTGIGFDGEELDNVTGLPKPRILVERGTWVAVAEGCLAVSEARVEPAVRSGVKTPLGEVVIGEVRTRGRLTLAGPNKRRELRLVLDLLAKTDCPLCLVDGALNRIVPMVETDALILATGAARTTDLDRLAAEAGAVAALFALPGVPEGVLMPPVIALGTADGRLEQFSQGSLLETGAARSVAERVSKATTAIFLPGIATEQCLAELIEGIGPRWPGKALVLASVPHILAFGRPREFGGLLDAVRGYGGSVAVYRPLPLLAVTVNPFHPEAGPQTMRPAYVDAIALEKAVREKVAVPVIDVARSGGGRLGEIVLGQRKESGDGEGIGG